jgi:hypothetical protein
LLRVGDVESLDLVHAGAEFDVGAAARHVRGDGHRAALAGAGDDLGLLLDEFRVEHVVDDALALEHPREQLARLDRDGADQHRLALGVRGLDLRTTALYFSRRVL